MNYITESHHLIDISPDHHSLTSAQKHALYQDPGAIAAVLWDLMQNHPNIEINLDWSKGIQQYIPAAKPDVLYAADDRMDYIYHSDENVEYQLITATDSQIVFLEQTMGGDWQSAVDATVIITPTTFQHTANLKYRNHALIHYVDQLEVISKDIYHKSLHDLRPVEAKSLLEELINTLATFFIINDPSISPSVLEQEVLNYTYKSASLFTINHYALIINQAITVAKP